MLDKITNRQIFFLGFFLGGVFLPTLGHSDEPSLLLFPPVVVTATRVETPLSEVAQSITVFTTEDLKKQKKQTLPEILRDVPGLALVQTGGAGGLASVFMRGTQSNHTKVLIDGVDVRDPSSPTGAFDFSQLALSDIERIEILRGPQSGLYGSDALGGVVQIFTQEGEGPARWQLRAEGGSFETYNQSLGVRGSSGDFSYTLSGGHQHTGQMMVTPSDLLVPGRPLNSDSFDQSFANAKIKLHLNNTLNVGGIVRYSKSDLRFVSRDFLGPEAQSSTSNAQFLFLKGFGEFSSSDQRMKQKIGVSYIHYHREVIDPNTTPAARYFYGGERVFLDWQTEAQLSSAYTVILGSEYTHEAEEDLKGRISENKALFGQILAQITPALSSNLSARGDLNNSFGMQGTYRFSSAYRLFEMGSKLKASIGTGFKAPTLEQLYRDYPAFNFFSNPLLKPEESLGVEIGFEQAFLDERLNLGVTYFNNKIRNLIASNATFTQNENIGRAQTYGVESFISYQIIDPLVLRVDYTWTVAQDEVKKTALLRRPEHKINVTGTWQVSEKFSLSGGILYLGGWYDLARSGWPSGVRAKGYTLANLGLNYDLKPGVQLFCKLNNLFDTRIEDPLGYLKPGFGAFLGMEIGI